MTVWCPTMLVEQKSDKWNSKTICIIFFPMKTFSNIDTNRWRKNISSLMFISTAFDSLEK